jgi:uncharacterized protein YuzE
MELTEFKLSVSNDDSTVAYLWLPGHPGVDKVGAVTRQIRLGDLVPCSGPDIYVDLDGDGKVIGIEILA